MDGKKKKKSDDLVVAEERSAEETLSETRTEGIVTDVEATDEATGSYGLDGKGGSKFSEELKKVYSKYKPSREEIDAVQDEIESVQSERKKKAREIEKEISEVPLDEEEREIAEKRKAIQKMKLDQELDAATAEHMESKIQTLFKMRQLTDPRVDPMVSFDTRQKAANKRLDDAYQQGLTSLEGLTPKAPELEDEGINAKQAAITLAIQSMTGIMGSISGSQAGLRASTEAMEKGSKEIIANVEARQKHNAGLMKAYGQSMSKHRDSTQKYIDTYLKEVGHAGRNEVTEFVKHSFNIEKIAIDKRKAALDEGKAKLDRLKLQGEVSEKQYAEAVDVYQNEKAGLDSFQQRMLTADKNDITAQKANLMASIKQMKMDLAQLRRKGLKLPISDVMLNTPNAPGIISDINNLTETDLGNKHWQQSTQTLRGYTAGLRGLDTIFTLSQLRGSKARRDELEDTVSSLTGLVNFMETTGTVPRQAHMENLAALGLKPSKKGFKFNAIPGFRFRTARNPAELRKAQWQTLQKMTLLTNLLERAYKSVDKREEREDDLRRRVEANIIGGGRGRPSAVMEAGKALKALKERSDERKNLRGE